MTNTETYISETKAYAALRAEGFKPSFEDKYLHKDGKKARIIKTGYFEYKIQVK